MADQSVFMITHSCGHAQARDLSADPASKRTAKATWWTERICTACLKAQPRRKTPPSAEVRAEREQRRRDALADQEASNLPPLRGSESQQNWALTVRYELIQAAYEGLVQSEQLTEDEFDEQVLVPVRRVDYAGWWIDVKDNTTEELLSDLTDVNDKFLASENPY